MMRGRFAPPRKPERCGSRQNAFYSLGPGSFEPAGSGRATSAVGGSVATTSA
jgi:hypothetical protein